MSADTLTKARIAEQVQARVGLSRRECGELVDDVVELMRGALLDEGKLKLAGLGTWTVREKAARRGRNPQTSEAIIIARRRVVAFKPAPSLRLLLNPKA